MAWASIGTLGSFAERSAGTTIVLTTTAAAEVGNVVEVLVAIDNVTTTTGASTDISVTDSAGNTYTPAMEQTQTNGFAADGVTVGLFYSQITTELALGGTITATFPSLDAATIDAWEFSVEAGSTISVAGSASIGGVNSDPGDVTIGSLASSEYLWAHALAVESNASGFTYTEDADYTSFDAPSTTGGLALSNVSLRGGWRIFTGTTDTVNVGATAASLRQWRQVYVALLETAGGGTTTPVSLDLTVTSTVVMTKRAGLPRSIGGTASPVIVKQANTNQSVTTVGVAASTFSAGKLLGFTTTSSLSLVVSRAFLVALSLTVTSAVSILKTAGKVTGVTAVGVVSSVTSVGKAFALSVSGAPTATKQIAKSFALTVTSALSVVATFIAAVVAASGAQRLVGLIRGVGKLGKP